jgi:MFS family permease
MRVLNQPANRSTSEASPSTALAALCIAMLLASLGTSIANVALPTLSVAFGARFQDVQWVVIAYLLAVTSSIVGVARLGDLIGRKRVFLAGIAAFTLASALCGAGGPLWLLVVSRIAQGAGAAAMMALSMTFVAESVPQGRAGSALGLLGAMSAAGTALGPVLGGLLIAAFGWQAIFLVNVPVGLAAWWLARLHLPADEAVPPSRPPGFDHAGMLLLALTLAAFALAMTLGRGGFGAVNLALLAAAGFGLLAFLRVEAKAPAPLIRLALFQGPVMGGRLSASVLVAAVMMTTLVVGPFYLSGVLELGPASAGLVLAAAPVLVAVTATPAGRLSDRFGAGRVSVIGLSAIAAGCAVFAALPVALGIPGYLAAMALVASGYAAFQTANNALVLGDAPAGERGVVSGLLNLSRNLGLIAGAAAMGALFRLALGTGDITAAPPSDLASATRITFGAAALLAIAALAATSWLRSAHPSRPSPAVR